MKDIHEQEMQNRIDSLTLEKEKLRYEIDCPKEQIAQLKKMAFGSLMEKTKKILKDVPHEEGVITPPENERICKCCRTQLTSMDWEKSVRKNKNKSYHVGVYR